MGNNGFSKKIFALLLETAKGPRSWRQFTIDCGISYVQMRKLAQCEQENPPRPKLIRKIADHSFNDIDFEDFMFAAGMIKDGQAFTTTALIPEKQEEFYVKYRALSQKDKNTVVEFMSFLLEKSER